VNIVVWYAKSILPVLAWVGRHPALDGNCQPSGTSGRHEEIALNQGEWRIVHMVWWQERRP
jgi:hypothetical protein